MTNPQNNDVRIAIGYDLDTASVSKTERALTGTDKNITDLAKQAKAGSREIGLFARAQENAAKSGKATAQTAYTVADALRKEAKAAQEAANKLEERNQQLKSNAPGDFAGGAGKVGSALEGLGLKGAGQIAGAGQIVGDLAEGIPKLKSAVAGLPASLSSAAAALGPAGIVVGAVAAGAVALEMLWKRSIQDMEKELKAFAEASADFVNFASSGGTAEDAARMNEEAQRRIELAQAEIHRIQDEYAERNFHLWDRMRNDGEQALADQVEAFESMIDTEQAGIERRKEAIESGELATNDAIAAERELASERSAGVLNTAAQAGELAATRERLKNATQEQIAAELKSIETKRISIEAELQSLRASGDTSEQVQKKIEQLTSTLRFLGEQTAQLGDMRSKAKTEKQVEAEKKLAAARDESAKASDKAAESEKRFSGSRESGRAGRQPVRSAATIGGLLFGGKPSESAKEAQKEADKIADINQSYFDKLEDMALDFLQDREKDERKAQFEFAKIRRDAERNEKDAIRERNFAAAADVREDAAQQKQDLKDQLKFEEREREIAYREQQNDARRNYDRQLRDLQNTNNQKLSIENNFYQKSLGGLNNYFNQWIQMQNQALKATKTSSTTNSSSSPSSLFNQLSMIQG